MRYSLCALLAVCLISLTYGKGGAVFTRWGKTECPPGNDFVYRGRAGGTEYRAKAGPANILCLPEHPIYANYTADDQYGSHIYGTEYYSSVTTPDLHRLNFHDVPCAVCRSQTKRSVIMVPARNKCFPGWRLEYWGYLMSGQAGHASSEFICIDDNAEAAIGGHGQKGGKYVYPVQSMCGTLLCPPYHNGRELTCAVCSSK